MAIMDGDTLELVLRYVVLPAVIGVFSLGILIYFDTSNRRKTADMNNKAEQIKAARELYKDVMADAEHLLSMMRYHAWNIAWRKMRPEGIFSEDLIEEDIKKWNIFDDALMKWRRNKIQYKAAIDVSFGKRGAASRLFRLIDATFDKLSFEIWHIYHENPNNPNVFLEYFVEDIEQHYDTIFNCIMTAIDKELTREQEDNVHRTVSIAFDELQDKINRMCLEMSESIKKGNVGNLRQRPKRVKRRVQKTEGDSKESSNS